MSWAIAEKGRIVIDFTGRLWIYQTRAKARKAKKTFPFNSHRYQVIEVTIRGGQQKDE